MILFLDFDGPLFPERHIPHSLPMSAYPGINPHPWMTYWEMDKTSVRQLNALRTIFPFETVISSSWINLLDKDQVLELFAANMLNLNLHDDWCIQHNGRFSATREQMIGWWLKDQLIGGKKPSHIILDDPWSGQSLCDDSWQVLGLLEPFIVDPDVGIDSACYNNMKRVALEWSEDPSTRTY